MSKKTIFSLIIVLGISGCSMTPVKPTSELSTERPAKVVAALIENQAIKCWVREFSFTHDGIQVDARKSISDTYLISIARYARDIGLRNPHFVAEVIDQIDGSVIKTNEGDYACSLMGRCYSLDYTNDVKKWLEGDLSCFEKDEPWI